MARSRHPATLLGWVLAAALLLGLAAWLKHRHSRSPVVSGPMPHEAYLWQRAWTPPVVDAITSHGTNFNQLIALAAEAAWREDQFRVVRADLDYEILRKLHQSVGLALRVGPYSGPFRADHPATQALADLAGDILRKARDAGVRVTELQLDFDCAESKLDGYRVWVEAMGRRIDPVPLVVTALPSWLDRRAFRRLARAADGYVIQVHSLERPRSILDPFTLCDPAAARRAVERAGRVGVPFRVALPTYGYIVAFDGDGEFLGLSAEGPSQLWPADAQLRRVQARPEAMAGLVQSWTVSRPESMRAIVWYRLPVATDQLNWPWATLRGVMRGETPRAMLRAEARQPDPALVELDLVNQGSADGSGLQSVTLRWQDQRLIACDGLAGFEVLEETSHGVRFRGNLDGLPLKPGERRQVGWARFHQPVTGAIEVRHESE